MCNLTSWFQRNKVSKCSYQNSIWHSSLEKTIAQSHKKVYKPSRKLWFVIHWKLSHARKLYPCRFIEYYQMWFWFVHRLCVLVITSSKILAVANNIEKCIKIYFQSKMPQNIWKNSISHTFNLAIHSWEHWYFKRLELYF